MQEIARGLFLWGVSLRWAAKTKPFFAWLVWGLVDQIPSCSISHERKILSVAIGRSCDLTIGPHARLESEKGGTEPVVPEAAHALSAAVLSHG